MTILWEKDDYHILTLTINRPEVLNALNISVLQELREKISRIEKEEDIKVVIITGAGEKAFVAGADIKEMASFTPKEALAYAALGHQVFARLEALPKPVIAAINGYCLGGGLELAMACDIRVSVHKAKLGQPEVGLGIIPGFGGSQRLPRLVGKGKASELIFTGKGISGEEAWRIGLVNKVVDEEVLLKETKELAYAIVKNSGNAISLAKMAIKEGLEEKMPQALEIEKTYFSKCFLSTEQKEGFMGYLEKRKPKFN